MFVYVTFLIFITQLLHEINTNRACVPDTRFVVNNFQCFCNHQGQWNDADCEAITRRHSCQPGQTIKQDCLQCVCKVDGSYKCYNTSCSTDAIKLSDTQALVGYGPRCTPFRSYYINCSLCVCPASGQSVDAQCAFDTSCKLNTRVNINSLNVPKEKYCMPKVLYVFPCIQCLCSEDGNFALDKCIETCHTHTVKPIRRCIPGTLYRLECNICQCPENSLPDMKLCEKVDCNKESTQPTLKSLRSDLKQCKPYVFTNSKCLFCDCTTEGTVNENACLELNCSKMSNFQYYSPSKICSPGELVPICMECFCLRTGAINMKYCTSSCSNRNKLKILEDVLKESTTNSSLIDPNRIDRISGSKCQANSLYLDKGRYCLCPRTGDSTFNYCTSVFEYSETPPPPHKGGGIDEIDFNSSCKPSTLVEFGCNTCFCTKNGKIDPKWCTYDDCEAKKIIRDSHKSRPIVQSVDALDSICTPGSISTVKCNFCICPENGNLKDRVCTKNDCIDIEENLLYDKFTCEPLAYYEVDCNICYCPRDGLKNVAKCTKNHCESNFLRSDYCVPSHLFSDGCNVCVCPLDGNKEDKACTNHTCDINTWNFFKLTQTLLENNDNRNSKRNLDLCFPGEEFVEGCKVCVCPELGLKTYATCQAILCEEMNSHINFTSEKANYFRRLGRHESSLRARRDLHEECFIYNASNVPERHVCTPGTMYIVRCKQCICPYVGNINNFCRPLPKTMYCEQAYPGFNYMPMGRRDNNGTTSLLPTESSTPDLSVPVKHIHTKYRCKEVGKVMDTCFICQCEEGNVLVVEHCFRNEESKCLNATPSFLAQHKEVIL